MAAWTRCRAHAEPLSLENPEPRDVADTVLRDRRADDRHIEAHILARDLVEIDDLKAPAATQKGDRAVIASNAGRLNRHRCHLPRDFSAFGRFGNLQRLDYVVALRNA